MSFKQRNRQPELMDAPDLNDQLHHAALTGLRRVNWLSGTDRVIWRAIRGLAASPTPVRTPLKILDIASGGGDLAIALARRFDRARVAVEIEGCDISETAIRYARDNAAAAGAANVTFTQRDVLTNPPSENSYDVVMCTLFLHHLEESDAVRLLRTMCTAARQRVLVDDLRRTALGYWMAWIGTRLLTRCPIVHVDGPLSVAGAFTVAEARELATAAGCVRIGCLTHWPQRFLLMADPGKSAAAESVPVTESVVRNSSVREPRGGEAATSPADGGS
ncbi:MAG: methyltransferase domain-containing protein [Planctomycetaceae bacterium]|nr:methyltransferase domain-containing protein [Planctomycetaceae bacterium]